MRRDVLDLGSFYQTPLGEVAQAAVTRQLALAWGEAAGLDVLGVGYATPFLRPFVGHARRVVAAMPAQQGAEVWSPQERGHRGNLACLVEDTQLPFPSALFDRILIVHALEEAAEPRALLEEAARVLAPSGRIIIAAVNRRSLWSGAEATPMGHGRPYTRSQLESDVREAGLEPAAWSRALYTPPWPIFARYAEVIEQTASRLQAPLSGLILLEAEKRAFAVRPRRERARIIVPALRPSPVLPLARDGQSALQPSNSGHSSP